MLEHLAQRVEGGTCLVELLRPDASGPALFEVCDSSPGVVEQRATAGGGEDEFCASVGGVGATFEVAEPLEIVDQFRACSEAELRSIGELRESDAVDAHIPPDLEMGQPHVRVARACCGGEEVGTEFVEQANEELADRKSLRRHGG